MELIDRDELRTEPLPESYTSDYLSVLINEVRFANFANFCVKFIYSKFHHFKTINFNKKIILILTLLTILIYIIIKYENSSNQIKNDQTYQCRSANNKSTRRTKSTTHVQTRDYLRYDCTNMTRIGGNEYNLRNAPDPLYRIDGSWFICLDGNLRPKSNCNIFSFGINNDYTFDQTMNEQFGCHVYSFDPFVEADLFARLRRENTYLSNSIRIPVNPKWNFYKYESLLF